ncbi:hypothetical protein B9K06_26835, partial [Bacillus sp. OG2]
SSDILNEPPDNALKLFAKNGVDEEEDVEGVDDEYLPLIETDNGIKELKSFEYEVVGEEENDKDEDDEEADVGNDC